MASGLTAAGVGGVPMMAAAASPTAAAGAAAMGAPTESYNELAQILTDSQSSNSAVRVPAEKKLALAERSNFPEFLKGLAIELADESKPDIVRQLAGIVLKNAISSKDTRVDKVKREKWLQLQPPEVTEMVRSKVFPVLGSQSADARNATCQVLAKIGRLDVPGSRWSALVPSLSEIATTRTNSLSHRRSAVVTLGYLCEDLNLLGDEFGTVLLSTADTNSALTAVIHACNGEEELALAGFRALYHLLLFAKENMSSQTERSIIVNTITSGLKRDPLPLKQAAWEAALQLATEYYEFLESCIMFLGQTSLETIKSTVEAASSSTGPPRPDYNQLEQVALASVELWNTLADVEYSFIEDPESGTSMRYISQAKEHLLPVLFEAMAAAAPNVDDTGGDDTWTLSMAAGTCLSLCAMVLQEEIIPPVLSFVDANFTHKDWRYRDAAILAYGSITDGPPPEKLRQFISSSFAQVCKALDDSSPSVRETTAWVVGRVAAKHANCLLPFIGTPTEGLYATLLQRAQQERPRVASYLCFAVHEIARTINFASLNAAAESGALSQQQQQRNILDAFFTESCKSLLMVANRDDADEGNLRVAAFEAMNEVLANTSTVGTIAEQKQELGWTLLGALRQTAAKGAPTSSAAEEELFQVQGLLCGALSAMIESVEVPVKEQAFEINAELLKVLEIYRKCVDSQMNTGAASSMLPSAQQEGGDDVTGSISLITDAPSAMRTASGLDEEIFLAFSSLLHRLQGQMEPFVPQYLCIINDALSKPSQVRYCKGAVALLSDICANVGLRQLSNTIQFSTMMDHLFNVLRMPDAAFELKPQIITAVGDVCSSLEDLFQPYLKVFLELHFQAASTEFHNGPETEEWREYFQSLRDAVLDAICALVHGMRTCLSELKVALESWLRTVERVLGDAWSSDSNIQKAVDVLSDILAAFPPSAALVGQSGVFPLLDSKMAASDDPKLKSKYELLLRIIARIKTLNKETISNNNNGGNHPKIEGIPAS